MDIAELMQEGLEAKNGGDFREALDLYKQASELLIEEATQYTMKQKGMVVIKGDVGEVSPDYVSTVMEYIKDNPFSRVLYNNLGAIYVDCGDIELAKENFEEAINFTPDGVDYPQPKENLEKLKQMVARVNLP